MDTLLQIPEIQGPLRRALRRTGTPPDRPPEHLDPALADALAREVHGDARLPDRVRAELLGRLVGIGPGGLQALSWLAARGQADAEQIRAYAARLPAGRPAPGALSVPEALQAAERLMAVELPQSQRLGLARRLLASPLFSEGGRGAVFQRLLGGPWLSRSDRRRLLEWALGTGSEELGRDGPAAPPGLARPALAALVELGEDAGAVARYALTHLEAWPDSRPVLQGLLDLVERYGAHLQPLLRRQLLDAARSRREEAVRRRAYQIGARTEGMEFLREALRDSDPWARSWAMSRLAQRG